VAAVCDFQLKICILKIVTFNINNINKRLDNLVAWLRKTEPDVVCLQELKAEQRAFPERALRALGYHSVWQGQRSLERRGDPRARARAGTDSIKPAW